MGGAAIDVGAYEYQNPGAASSDGGSGGGNADGGPGAGGMAPGCSCQLTATAAPVGSGSVALAGLLALLSRRRARRPSAPGRSAEFEIAS